MTVEDARPPPTVSDAAQSSGLGLSQPGYEERHEALRAFFGSISLRPGHRLCEPGHPMEVGHHFLENVLPGLTGAFNRDRARQKKSEPVPLLGALVCTSAFDLALHDAFGVLHGVSTYETYNARYMNHDLAHFVTPAPRRDVSFAGRFPVEFLTRPRLETIPAWHLIGGAIRSIREPV